MANNFKKHPLNSTGKFFCTGYDDLLGEGCIACGLCYQQAPHHFKEDENGYAYVYKQPNSSAEEKLCLEQLNICPVNAIGM